jgi:hypothetical protein
MRRVIHRWKLGQKHGGYRGGHTTACAPATSVNFVDRAATAAQRRITRLETLSKEEGIYNSNFRAENPCRQRM